MYDESLVYMAQTVGMTLCDIMYTPCGNSSWAATKCTDHTAAEMSEDQVKALTSIATTSGEMEFYNSIAPDIEAKLSTPEIKSITTRYQTLRQLVLGKCNNQATLAEVQKLLLSSKGRVTYRKDRKGYTFHILTDGTHVLDPLTVCLGRVCQDLPSELYKL